LQVETIENIVPALEQELLFYPFNKSEFLVQHKTLNYQVNINRQTYQLIKLIDGKCTIKEISATYKSQYITDLSPQIIYTLLYKKLAKFGIIKQNEFRVEKRKRASYLKLSFIILRKEYIKYFTKYLIFLFHKKLFYALMIFMSLFIGFMIFNNYQLIIKSGSSIFSINLILYVFAFQFGTLFHELGHATACTKFGAKHGGIGFGFYLLTPVFFADVSDAWKLKPNERIIVNLGGIYFEMILASILLILYLFNSQIAFLIIPCLLILSTLYNLNPLLRFDGYWVLVDATNIPNIQSKAFTLLGNKLKGIKKMRFSFKTKKEAFLFIYGIVSVSFIFFFIGSILIYDPNAVFRFPFDLYDIITDWRSFEFAKVTELILPLLFWYLVIRLIINQFNIMKKKSKVNDG